MNLNFSNLRMINTHKYILAVLIVISRITIFAGSVYPLTPDEYVNLGFGWFPHYNINTYSNTYGGTGDDPVRVNYPANIFLPGKEYDAYKWVDSARKAGMQYMVFTAKHRYGFCMWDSAYTDYDVAECYTPNTDIMRDVASACQYYGMPLVVYYNSDDRDWRYLNDQKVFDNPLYTEYVKNQMQELFSYGPFLGVWFDHAGSFSGSQANEIENFIKETLQSDALVIFHGNGKDDCSDVLAHEYNEPLPDEFNVIPWEQTYIVGNKYWSWNDEEKPAYDAIWVRNTIKWHKRRHSTASFAISPGPGGTIPPDLLRVMTNLKPISPEDLYLGWNLVDDCEFAIPHENSVVLKYAGVWWQGRIDKNNCFLNTYSLSRDEGATATMHFTGTGLRLFINKTPNSGLLDVYIDNIRVDTIDAYSSELMERQAVFEINSLKFEEHSVQIVVSGNKNPASGNHDVEIDYLEYYYPEGDSFPNGHLIVDETEDTGGLNTFSFFGESPSSQWKPADSNYAYQNTVRKSSSKNDYYIIKFYGTKINWYSIKGPQSGKTALSIDGNAEVLIDCFNETWTRSSVLFESNELPEGYHTLKVRVCGEKNDLSINYEVYADRVDINPADAEDIPDSKNTQSESGGCFISIIAPGMSIDPPPF